MRLDQDQIDIASRTRLMNDALSELVRIASRVKMSDGEREEQRIRFSYGSAKIENDRVTEDMVREAAEALKAEAKADG